MSADKVAIRVDGVSKHYLMFDQHGDRLKQLIIPRLQRFFGREPSRYSRDFPALAGVTLEVKRGETVGIVGRNGSGKSTLLQVVCGILRPTDGAVEVKGRIAALLELGAGFNPDFTGRENVYLNAAILGLPRAEIDSRFHQIASFADIGDFIDQPVKTFSSGMYIRLAFAVAINVDPDILIIDEALAVGDQAFQRKCFSRIEDVQKRGGTILFVSHNAQAVVQLCNRAILMDRGELILEGRPKTVVNQYLRLVNLNHEAAEPVRVAIQQMDGWAEPAPQTEKDGETANEPDQEAGVAFVEVAAPDRQEDDDESWFDPSLVPASTVAYESRGAQIRDVRITTPGGRPVNVLQLGHRYVYEYHVDFERAVVEVGFGMMAKTIQGQELAGASTRLSSEHRISRVERGQSFYVTFSFVCHLTPNTYFLNAGVSGVPAEGESRQGDSQYLHRLLDVHMFRVSPVPDQMATGLIDLEIRPKVELLEHDHDLMLGIENGR